MEYYSCSFLETCALNFNGRIDQEKKCITFCCENLKNLPGIAFQDSPEKTLQCFTGLQSMLLAESRKLSCADGLTENRCFPTDCIHCANYKKASWAHDGLIHYVNLSMYPSPCQCKCIYCGVARNIPLDDHTKECYEKLFDTLELAKRSGLIAADASWQISPGEITLHPYRQRIFDLVSDSAAMFYTNGFVFSEEIAENFQRNPNSSLNISLDSGTAETWRKVKGVDNFEQVIQNLIRYRLADSKACHISVKYILLVGVNDNYNDFLCLMEILKALQVSHLTISRDVRKKYHFESEEHHQLLVSAALLLAICHKNNISCDMFTYTTEEQKKVLEYANSLLQNNQL